MYVKNKKMKLFLSVITLSMICLNACSTYDRTTRKIANQITPYRIDIIQGQAITKEQMEQIKIGMSRNDVKLNLGTPSINSLFADNTWIYVFFYRNGNADVVKKRQVTLQFNGDKLSNIEADELPSQLELVKEIDKNK
jgi:outer membrane protein assembly factor BamE